MNKLLFLAVFAVTLFTLSYGEVKIEEDVLADTELSQLRVVREADPKNAAGVKKNNDGKKKRKSNRKGKKQRKVGKKSNRKTNKTKTKKGTMKNRKKTRKSKNGGKKKKAAKKSNKNSKRKGKKPAKKSVKNKGKSNKNRKTTKKGKNKSAKKSDRKKAKDKNSRKAAKKNRKAKKNNKKGGNKRKAAKKNKKHSKKNEKKSAKKERKNKEKRNKNKTKKTKGKKNARKANKKKKAVKKTNKTAKNTQRKVNNGRQSDSCDTSAACIGNATAYYELLQKRVRFFNQQKERIKTFSKQSGGKNKKKDVFADLVNRLREASGGNSSNVTCNGEVNNGSEMIENLQASLKNCSDNIKTACDETADGPKKNQTLLDECAAKVKIFEDLTTEASAAKGSAACALWESDDISTAAANIKECTKQVVDMNKEVTQAKKACTNAFSACRKEEDAVSGAISACSPANTKDKIICSLVQANKNKAAAEKLSEKLSSESSGSTTTGDGSAVTCGDFITKVSEAIKKIMDAPIALSTEMMITDVVSNTISPECSEEEKTSLMSSIEDLAKAITEIDDTIAVKQEDNKMATGEEIPDSDLVCTTTEAPNTTAAKETTALGDTTAQTTAEMTAGQTNPIGATAAGKRVQLKKLLQLQKMRLQKQHVL